MATRSPSQSAGNLGKDLGAGAPGGARPVRFAPVHLPKVKDTTDYAHRHFVNLASAALLLFIAIAIIWTVKAMEDYHKLQRCIDSGRRNCVDLNIPPRHGVHHVGRNISQ